MQRQQRWVVPTLVILCCTLLGIFKAGAQIQVNNIMLVLRDTLAADLGFSQGRYSILGVLENDPEISEGIDAMLRAQGTGMRMIPASWTLGRLALAIGDTDLARRILSPLPHTDIQTGLLYQDVLLSKTSEEALDYYQQNLPPHASPIISDTLAWAIVDHESDPELTQALAFRPTDLYLNLSLWQTWSAINPEKAIEYLNQVKHFSLESIAPTDRRFLTYTMQAILAAITNKWWSVQDAQHVIAFLVWQYSGVPAIEKLILDLIDLYPSDPQWLFYLAEYYHRSKDYEQAEELYKRVLTIDPTRVIAYLRLGEIAESACTGSTPHLDCLRKARQWYEQYYRFSPQDLIVIEKLKAVLAQLGDDRERSFQQQLDKRKDDVSYVARVFGMPSAMITLGPNLVENGSLVHWNFAVPTNFFYWSYRGIDGTGGAYANGRDTLGTPAARLTALRSNLLPDGTTPYAEYYSNKFTLNHASYLVTVDYCADGFDMGGPLVVLAEHSNQRSEPFLHQFLPDTEGQCHIARFIVDNPIESNAYRLSVRNWGSGDLRIRSIQVRRMDWKP